jgi:hypothetical protein
MLFAHGAGAPSTHPWMVGWDERLAGLGPVERFDYPYMQRGSRRPDRLPKLVAAHREALASLRRNHPGEPVVLIGKSMGSRVGCHVSLEEQVQAVVCLGYPLVSGGKTRKRRDEVLLAMDTPVLFVQGTRDPMGPLEVFAEVRQRMTAPNALHVVETGDHSLRITKTHTKQTGIDQEASDAQALAAITRFLERQSRSS